MSTTPGNPRIDLRGAIDLSALGRTPAPAPGGQTAGGAIVDITDEQAFSAVVQQSSSVPVVLVLWASWSEASTTTTADLAALATELEGRFLLARLDADSAPQLAQAIGAQAVPTVIGVLRGQPVPLAQGPATREQLRDLVDRLLEVAAANQITGRVAVGDAPEDVDAEPEEPPLPPLHAAAYDAIEAGDLAAAEQAYRTAIAQNPRDDLAVAGLAQVQLLARVGGLDAAAVLARAADQADVDAQLDAADLELASGQVAEAFARLVATVRRTAGPDRERVRERLVSLFTVVGEGDPLVATARRNLASALF
jgi:putative thioredoxin